MVSKPRLVIVGTGWAGFYIAQYIDQSMYDVTIISPRRTSAYTPLLASAAVGLFNFYLAEEQVRSKSRKAIHFLKATVSDIDFRQKTCQCAPAFDEDPDLAHEVFSVPYDILCIAPGCMPNTFGTPGVAEHALFMKNVSDAMAVRKLLFDLLEKASLPSTTPERRKELLHVAIVGGGPTGIELTAELSDMSKHELEDLYPNIAHDIHLTIFDAAPNILGAYEKSLHEYATAQLQKRNTAIEVSSTIEKVDREALYTKEKGRIPYGMLIWATGNKNVALVEKLAVRLSEKGLKRIQTDSRLRVYQSKDSDAIYDDVYALGDAADIYHESLPTTAEVAVQKARYLVDMLNARAAPSNASPNTKPFTYTQKRLVSYIGQHDGVIAGKGEGGEGGWTGASAWLAWRSGSIMWTRSWRHRAAIVITWCLNTVFGKEIARM